MRKGPQQSPEQMSRDRRNKYLLKKFNITLEDKEQRHFQQGGVCPVCNGPLDAHGPSNVDHYHARFEARRAEVWEDLNLPWRWVAFIADEQGTRRFETPGKTKVEALRKCKALALPWLIRGLLCAKCNKGLGYIERFFDAARFPNNLDAIKAYFLHRLEQISLTRI